MHMPMQLFPWQFFRVCVPFTDNIIFLSRHFAQFLWKCRIGTVYEAQSLASSEIIFFFVFYFLHQINLTWLVLLGKEDVVGNLSAPCTSVFAILFNVAVYEYCACFLIFCCTLGLSTNGSPSVNGRVFGLHVYQFHWNKALTY